MKAILLDQPGGVDHLIFKEIDQPMIKDQEVLIEVKAISINPVDYKVRRNGNVLKAICGENDPIILGWDIAGVVVKTGKEVSQYQIGDRVFGMVNFPGAGNAYAEFVAAPAAHLAKIPANTSFEEAAATTLAALTALQVLQNNIKKGDRVLIHAGSGGVGHFAIQVAKSLGAYVMTTSSAKNKDFVMALGADEHIDYHAHAFQDVVTDVDFIFDLFNGDILFNSVKAVKEGGSVYSIPSPDFSEAVLKLAEERKVNLSFLMVQSNEKDMHTLAGLLENKTIKAHVSKTFSFEAMAQAHEQLESGRTVGKVIVKL